MYTDRERSGEDQKPLIEPDPTHRFEKSRTYMTSWSNLALIYNIFGSVAIVAWAAFVLMHKDTPWHTDRLYSPADTAVQREDVTFTTGFWNTHSPFLKRPTEDSNIAWGKLYECASSLLPMVLTASVLESSVQFVRFLLVARADLLW